MRKKSVSEWTKVEFAEYVEEVMKGESAEHRLSLVEAWLEDMLMTNSTETQVIAQLKLMAYVDLREEERNELRHEIRKFRLGKDGVY